MRQKTAEQIPGQEFLKERENQPGQREDGDPGVGRWRSQPWAIQHKAPQDVEDTSVTVASHRGAQGVGWCKHYLEQANWGESQRKAGWLQALTLTAGKGIHKHGLTWKCSSELHSWMWEELQRSPPYTIKGSSPIQPSLCYFCGLPHNPRTESNPLIWNNKHCQVICCLMVLACDVGLWLLAGFWEVRFVGDLWFSIMFF